MRVYHVLLRMNNEDAKSLRREMKGTKGWLNDPFVVKAHLVALSETDDLLNHCEERNPNIVHVTTTDRLPVDTDVIASVYLEGCRLSYVPGNNFDGNIEEEM